MGFYFLIFACFSSFLYSHSIVFVHIGPELPDYLFTAIEQARLFNNDCPIYLIGNQKALIKAQFPVNQSIKCIPCESFSASKSHDLFSKNSKLDRFTFEGFWTLTSERFFYLEELIRQYNLKDVFHLENDVMLYVDLTDLLPVFQKHYEGKIGATFDNEKRCIPGFVYISEVYPISQLVTLMASRADAALNDMEIFQEFKNRYDHLYIDSLPIVLPEYINDYSLINTLGDTTLYPNRYCQNFTEFQSIFDAAAIGQYLGGISFRNGSANPGFINESCLFNPAFFEYHWKRDSKERLIPFIRYKNMEYPINNLHIHSKNLLLFFSKRS